VPEQVAGDIRQGRCGVPPEKGGLSNMSDILLRAAARSQSVISDLRHRDDGQTLPEYAIIIAAVAVLLMVALLFLSGRIGDLFSETGSFVSN
jgi:Flp pilus assembly pilin Flp